jgi:hypothetical protein
MSNLLDPPINFVLKQETYLPYPGLFALVNLMKKEKEADYTKALICGLR